MTILNNLPSFFCGLSISSNSMASLSLHVHKNKIFYI
ncbi:hypothetical protein OIU74_013936 [Salix koriyanagi]|uniref:Uncharacterized protein n=1 Tax=Salix koriyanagi TaxID=2511006 RepID=A0A9Q0SZ65_9ROSI|nr:hypothetical protein OIU74_013936 [Salix koriyanagi]